MKFYKSEIFTVLFMLLTPLEGFANDKAVAKSDPFEAVVRVKLKHGNSVLDFASGVFIGPKGELLVTGETMRPVFSSGLELEIESKLQHKTGHLMVINCNWELDLCLLKADVKPSQWIRLRMDTGRIESSVPVEVYGHTLKQDWVKTSSHWNSAPDTQDPAADFLMGAAVVGPNQELLGILTRKRIKEFDDVLHFQPTQWVSETLAKQLPLATLSDYSAGFIKNLNQENARLMDFVKTSIGNLIDGIDLSPQLFREIFIGSKEKIDAKIGKDFSMCQMDKHGGFDCQDPLHRILLRFKEKTVALQSLEGRLNHPLEEKEFLPSVNLWKAREEWDPMSAKLTSDQKDALMSVTQVPTCEELVRSEKTTILNYGFRCSSFVKNDFLPGAGSYHEYIEQKETLYEVTLWFEDPQMGEYAANLIPLLKRVAKKHGG